MIKYGHTDTKNKRTDTLDTFSKQKQVAIKQQVIYAWGESGKERCF